VIAPTTNYISQMCVGVEDNALWPHSLKQGAQIFHMLNMFKYSYLGTLIPIDDLRDRSPDTAPSFTKLTWFKHL